jgi:hypothetical protein
MWAVMHFGCEVHIVPKYDERVHFFVGCWCHPTPDDDEDDMFIHHALDQRELYETPGIVFQ